MDIKKFLILDMGKVLVEPATDNWFITPTFLEEVNMEEIDKEDLKNAINSFGHILDSKAENLEEEYEIIFDFYKKVFEKINYNIPKENLKNIVEDFTYNKSDSKYYLYDDVKEQLERLSKEYTILMLSDNWPCAIDYLKKHDIYKYFTKIYISSIFACRKIDKTLFDYPINDFNIQKGEAIFVDDNENLLNIAVEKGLNVLLMDRAKKIANSKYKTINNLSEI